MVVEGTKAIVYTSEGLGVDISQRTSSDQVKTATVTDPNGNRIAFAQAIDPSLAADPT